MCWKGFDTFPKRYLFFRRVLWAVAITIAFLVNCPVCRARDLQLPSDTIIIPYTNARVTIDGNLDDWRTYYHATFTDTCSHIHTTGNYQLAEVYSKDFEEGRIPEPLSRNQTDINICWDQAYLYFGYHVADEHLLAEFNRVSDHDKLFLNDGIELYVDAGYDSFNKMDHNDYQFIIDILNQSIVFKGDLRLAQKEDMLVPKFKDQNVLFSSAVSYQGSVNDPSDKDSGYVVEIRIPFAAIGIDPTEGLSLKLDICNNDADWLAADLGVSRDEILLTWPLNWSGLGDFGFPLYWKSATLSGKPALRTVLSKKYGTLLAILGIVALLIAVVLLRISYIKSKKLRSLSTHITNHNLSLPIQNHEPDQTENSHAYMLRKAYQFIQDHPSATITPQDVANNIHVSLRSLQRLTKEELHITPTSFIHAVKLDMACLFLKNKQGNISQAAYDFGFSDPAYFSRLFKKHFGLSPRQFILKHQVEE